MRRARDIDIISAIKYQKFCIRVRKEGWEKLETGKYNGEEKPVRDKNLLYRAISEGIISISKAASIANVTVSELENEIHTTDFVLNELNDLQIKILEKCINESKILLDKADADELVEIIKLQSKKRTLSITDMSVYYFAKEQNALILTGDKQFRNYAENNKMRVRGILWVLDETLHRKLLNKIVLADKLTKLMSTNKRLPADACKKRLMKWKDEN